MQWTQALLARIRAWLSPRPADWDAANLNTIQMTVEALSPSAPSGPRIVVTGGVQTGLVCHLELDAIRIGRAPDAELSIPDASLSRYHACVYRDDAGWSVRDLGSTNGTLVNGEKIEDVHLSNNTHVQLGTECVFRFENQQEQRDLEEELERVAAIQSALLPKQDTAELEHFQVAAFYRPLGLSSGDWWWYETRETGKLMVLVGDVAGHGQAPAMVTAAVAGSFQAIRGRRDLRDPLAILQQMNVSILRTCEGKFWMSMVALEIDPEAECLRCWFAGAPPALVMKPDDTIDTLLAPGHHLGRVPMMVTSTCESEFAPGYRLLVYTDGVTEMALHDNRRLGMRRLKDALRSTRGKSAQEARDYLVEHLTTLRGDSPFEDDATFVIIDRIG